MCLTGLHYYMFFAFYYTCRWKQLFSTLWPPLTKNWKALKRRIQTSFTLLTYLLWLIHLKDSILSWTPSWQCLCGVEGDVLPAAVHGKRFGATVSSPVCCMALPWFLLVRTQELFQVLAVYAGNNSLFCHCKQISHSCTVKHTCYKNRAFVAFQRTLNLLIRQDRDSSRTKQSRSRQRE